MYMSTGWFLACPANGLACSPGVFRHPARQRLLALHEGHPDARPHAPQLNPEVIGKKAAQRRALRNRPQPPYQRQAARNGVYALSDYRLYSFFTLSVHFGDEPIVDLPDTLDRRSWGEFDAYPGDEPCLKQAVNQVL